MPIMSAFVSTKHIPALQRISPEYAAFFFLSSSFCDSHKSLIRSSSPPLLLSSHLLSNSSLQLDIESNGKRQKYRMQF